MIKKAGPSGICASSQLRDLPRARPARIIVDRFHTMREMTRHPITNGVAEGLNSKIMSIKRKAAGVRNARNFTTATYFHCGGLDLYPR